MAGPKNNLEDVLRRRQENGTPSATPASPAPGQTKASKFKPASTTSIPKLSASRTSFSTPGFGRTKPVSSTTSAPRPIAQTVNSAPVHIPPRASTPTSATISRPAVPSKRPSPSITRLSDEAGSPKRQKLDRSPQKENFFDTSKGKGKARAVSRSPFSSPTKNKNRSANGVKPRSPSRRNDGDRCMALDYSDLLKASVSELEEEYSCSLDLKDDLIDLRDRYSGEGRSKYTLATLRRLQEVVQDRLDCLKVVKTAKRKSQPPTLPPPPASWAGSSYASSALKPPISALPLEHSISNSTTTSNTSISSARATTGSIKPANDVEEDDESHFWQDDDEALYESLPDEALHVSSDPFTSVPSSSSTALAVPTVPTVPDPSPIATPSSTFASTSATNFTTTTTSTSLNATTTVVDSTAYQQPIKSKTGWTDPAESPYYPEMCKILKSRFKMESFRPNQLSAIAHALSGRDVLVLLPTGGGKSLCFQLPALCRSGTTRGVTVVVGPLNALIDDQVNALRAKNIDVVDLRNTADEWTVHQELRSRRDEPCLLYITPEKLQANNTLRKTLDILYTNKRIARFVVDEAHVIGTWGRDFRPDYNKLSCMRDLWPDVPLMALTGSATEGVTKDIVNVLQMRDVALVKGSFNRPNLFYEVRSKPKNLVSEIANWINTNHRNMTGIVYCSSREGTEVMAKQLRFDFDIDAKHYHAKMDDRNKRETQNAWSEGRVKVVVATIAFGMGIDKPNVRFVIHSDVPSSLDCYYQETGRAGRDGNPSHCLLFLSYEKMQFWIRRTREGEGTDEWKAHAEEEYRRVYDFAANDVECRRVQILRYFGQSFDASKCNNQCDVCLNSDGHEVYEEDMSVAAKELLSLAGDMCNTVNLTKSVLIKVYRGSKAKAILMYQDRKYYGSGQKIHLSHVERLVQHLVSERYLEEVAWVTRDQLYTHFKLMTTAKATDFINNNGKLSLTMRRSGKTKAPAPESSKRRTTATSNPLRTTNGNGSDPWAIASSQVQKQTSSASDDEDDIEDDDDPVVEKDDDDDYITFMKIALAPVQVKAEGSRGPGRSRLPKDDPIEMDEDPKDIPQSRGLVLGGKDIQTLCYEALLELRTSLSKSTESNIEEVLHDGVLQLLSATMPNDSSSFTQALRSIGADWRALSKTVAQQFQHICIMYRMQCDELSK